MSKINELIQQLCPKGVKHYPLKDFFKISIGQFVHKDKQSIDGKYPVYNGGIIPTGLYDEYNNTGNKIIISARGANAGYINKIESNFWAGNSCYSLEVKNVRLLNYIFAYYYLKANQNVFTEQQQKGGIPAVSKKQVENFYIPIPPIQVQQEIVKILDQFTALDQELNNELQARKQQYSFYLNQLLRFEDKNVEYETLEECFYIKNGYTPSKSNSDYWENGDVPWFRLDDIRLNGRILNDSIQHITKQALKKGNLFSKNSIIISTSATIGEFALINVDFLCNQRFTCLSLKTEFLERINMRYVFYYMFILSELCKSNTNEGNFSSIDMSKFKKFKIPVPSLEEQERIVKILDQFDALVNDTTVGLPAEINARKQQYEYYRNQLLTFKPLD